jgi:uncharacterized membrane protein
VTTGHAAQPPSALPSVLYGVGLGGFVDGIVLHQLLQWHHLVSHTSRYPTTTVAGLEANTLADGAFHVLAWIVVVVAMVLTLRQWRRGRLSPSYRFHGGGMLLGWGLFNLVEGAVDHHLLGLHHVRDDLGAPLAWDLGFLCLGLALALVGAWLQHAGRLSGRGGGASPLTARRRRRQP